MNYQKIYANLVARGKNRVLSSYKERHHIIPKCLGGSNSAENLVDLTPEEHYLAHQLLVKIYNNNHALVKAAAMMICNRPSNKLYGWLRRKHSLAMSNCQAGAGNSQHGTRWIHNKTLRVSKKISIDIDLPIGWSTGRIVNFDAYFNQQELKKHKKQKLKKVLTSEQIRKKIKTKHINFRKTKEYRKAKSIKLYKEFKISNLSLRKFAEYKKMIPMTLSKWFNEFIIEYNIIARTSASKQL
jgi:predicted HTH domain antitoxin